MMQLFSSYTDKLDAHLKVLKECSATPTSSKAFETVQAIETIWLESGINYASTGWSFRNNPPTPDNLRFKEIRPLIEPLSKKAESDQAYMPYSQLFRALQLTEVAVTIHTIAAQGKSTDPSAESTLTDAFMSAFSKVEELCCSFVPQGENLWREKILLAHQGVAKSLEKYLVTKNPKSEITSKLNFVIDVIELFINRPTYPGQRRCFVALPYLFHIRKGSPYFFTQTREKRQELIKYFYLVLLVCDYFASGKRPFIAVLPNGENLSMRPFQFWLSTPKTGLTNCTWLESDPLIRQTCVASYPTEQQFIYPPFPRFKTSHTFKSSSLDSKVETTEIYTNQNKPNYVFLHSGNNEVTFMERWSTPPIVRAVERSFTGFLGYHQNALEQCFASLRKNCYQILNDKADVIKFEFARQILKQAQQENPEALSYCLLDGPHLLQVELYWLEQEQLCSRVFQALPPIDNQYTLYQTQALRGHWALLLPQLFPDKKLMPIEKAPPDQFIRGIAAGLIPTLKTPS